MHRTQGLPRTANAANLMPSQFGEVVDARGEHEMTASAPGWFTRAVASEAETGYVRVHGSRIGYRMWGKPGGHPVVLVHGGAANARWWDHVAPMLTTGRHIVALDLSGHGTSDHLVMNYSRDMWVDEVMAVASLVGDRPTIVGHSLGGAVTLAAAGRYGSDLAGVVVADTPIKFVRPRQERERWRRGNARLREYPTVDDIVARFRPDPEDAVLPPYLREYLGRNSIRAVPGGYRWQFDPRITLAGGLAMTEIVDPDCPVALIRGERGMLDEAVSQALAGRFGRTTLELTIPDGGHHLMLDQPLAFTAVLDTVLRSWAAAPLPQVSYQ